MPHTAPRMRILVFLAALAAVSVAPASAEEASPPPAVPPAPGAPPAAPKDPLPPGVVARVRGRDVTAEAFELELVRRTHDELDDERSGPYTVLRILLEETVVRQEAERLGLRVTSADYGRRYDEIDRQVREKSGGSQTLADVMRLQKMDPAEFRARLEDQIRKERIAAHPSYLGDKLPSDERARLAQVEIVIGKILAAARVEREGLPAGVAARVNGQEVSDALLGRALRGRLAESEVRRHLQEHCIVLLLEDEGLDFTTEQVDRALEAERPLYDRMRRDALDPKRQALSFDDFLLMRYQAPRAELRTSRYRRGLFALRERLGSAVTEDQVRAAWARGAQDEYGPSLVVREIVVSFSIPKAITEPVARRPREEAERVARDFLRRLRGGESWDAVAQEIRGRKDRSVVADRRAILRRGNDLKVYEALEPLADGAWAEPVETLSEFRVAMRERMRPAPAWEEARPVVRTHLVDQRAQVWLQEAVRDEVQFAP